MEVPTIPFYKATSKTYYGIEEMKKGELDFFKATVFSKNNEPVFMCSNMPMEDMAQDVEFGKKWMYAIAIMLKKGLHLNIIHNVDRPFNEMMLGLESWLPIYMTGQVSLPIHTISDNLLLRILFPPLLSKVQKFNKKFLYCSFIFIKTLFYIE